ncbi:MAG TPA: DNA repair protein RecN [Ignavibacteria bacterium]|nr:DNA repair protein RecN [Ignavibacteria bacterium]
MIEKLIIKNYLLIKDAEIDFTSGLNIITGETGAGKTIILDALSLILGDRADYSIIKNQENKLIIEGVFNLSGKLNIKNFLIEKNLDDNNGFVILRRELSNKGTSRSFINDTPVNITDLKEFGDMIIDIHSQNEHQSLLNKNMQLYILDKFAGLENQVYILKNDFEKYKELINNYNKILNKKESILEKKNLIDFQLKEINNINPQLDEEDVLENELNKLENSEDISNGLSAAVNLLYENENNIIAEISSVIKEIKKISKFDIEFEKYLNDLENVYINIKEISDSLINYKNNLNFDNFRIDQIRDRLGSLNFLKKKYNLSVNELIDKAKNLEEELNLAENFDFEIDKLKKNIEEEKIKLFNSALKISKNRKKYASDLEKNISIYLKDVALEHTEFKIQFDNYYSNSDENFNYKNSTITSNGIDDIEFMVKINKGTEFSTLRKSASGGEISRIMLSIKAALSGKDDISVLVFDEIDTGISGNTAIKVSKLLKELAKSHQIISITHLPQIAAKASNHLFVSKTIKNNITHTDIKTLTEEEKITEIAKMISGDKITDATIKSAKELQKN